MIIVISIVVAVFTAPVNLMVDFLFDDVLSAPTTSSIKAQNQNTAFQRAGRRMSNAVRRASVSVAGAVSSIRRSSVAAGVALVSIARGGHRKSVALVRTRVIPAETLSAQSLALACGTNLISRLKEDNANFDAELGVSLRRVAMSPEQRYSELVRDIDSQRLTLRPSEIEAYDGSWGVSERDESARCACWAGRLDSSGAIKREMEVVEEEVGKRYMKLVSSPDNLVGVELLQLLVLDLLGRDSVAAKIFEAKMSTE
jgi:hypothetical protein